MATTEYIWNVANDTVLMEKDGTGTTKAVYHSDPVPYGKLFSMRRDGKTSNYRYDGQGNTRALTDETGKTTDTYSYDAFGTQRTQTGTTVNPYRYGGQHGYQYNETTGEYYIRARIYQPIQSRWLSKDPILFVGGTNYYLYMRNSPDNGIDPSGLVCETAEPCCCCAKKLEFTDIKTLKPGVVVSTCFGRPLKIGPSSYGNEFLVHANLEKKVAEKEQPCELQYKERSTQTIVAADGTVTSKGCGAFQDQFKKFGTKVQTFKNWVGDMARIRCPGTGTAFLRDCPITPLKKASDFRLLCIEVVVKSTCDTCANKELTMYVKQVCEVGKSGPACKVSHGPTAKCTDKEWKKYCP